MDRDGGSGQLTPDVPLEKSRPATSGFVTKTFVRDIELAYRSFGPRDGEVVLLIAGLGEQLTRWPDDLIQSLLSHGFRVICFDNRDAGLSSTFDTAQTSDLRQLARSIAAGETIELPYGLDHMAQDALDLLTHIGATGAHVIGVSLGAMVAQLAAARRPEMIRSMTLIMTGTGDVAYMKPRPQVLLALMGLTASGDKEEQAVARGMAFGLALAGPAFPVDRQKAQARLIQDYRRAYRPFGVMRQLCAVLTQGNRSRDLAAITAPTEILHGSEDPMMDAEGARQVAAAIRNARLTLVEGMGHDFAPSLVATAIQLFLRAATRSRGAHPAGNREAIVERCP